MRDPDTREPLPAGEFGEIHLRGPNMMRGICGRLTSEVFDADGYYATGDLGALDADGYLWFAGRRDDMFKVSGATVYPTEVESALDVRANAHRRAARRSNGEECDQRPSSRSCHWDTLDR